MLSAFLTFYLSLKYGLHIFLLRNVEKQKKTAISWLLAITQENKTTLFSSILTVEKKVVLILKKNLFKSADKLKLIDNINSGGQCDQ